MTTQAVSKPIRKILPLLILVLLAMMVQALPLSAQQAPHKGRLTAVDPTSLDYERPIEFNDPWEGWNRGVYKFNYGFDKYLFLPLVKGYQFIVPKPARKGVTNFFTNLFEVRNFANNFLQGKFEGCLITFFRFAINTTLGLGGLLDPATEMGFPEWKEDFGQTLGVWGMGPGPYMVLPVAGPSTLRDTTGLVVDGVGGSLWVNFLVDEIFDWSTSTEDKVKWSLTGLQWLNMRSNIEFRYFETGSPFEYDLVQFIYLKNRELQIEQ